MKTGLIKYLLVAASLFATVSSALAQKTDPITLTEGFTEKKLGAKVEKIKVQNVTGMREVTISIPKKGVEGEIEEVVVTAPQPEKPDVKEPEIPRTKPYEFIQDYDNDHYGLIIYVGKEVRLPVRLYFSTGPDLD